jgi:APA family basic amino acid/polyamine antiporter
VPQFALVIQAVWTSILTLSGSYGNLLDYVVIAVLIFYILTVVGVFILRKKLSNLERTYMVWGYPIVPALYVVMATFICINLIAFKPEYTIPGIGIVVLGIPVYYLINLKKK